MNEVLILKYLEVPLLCFCDPHWMMKLCMTPPAAKMLNHLCIFEEPYFIELRPKLVLWPQAVLCMFMFYFALFLFCFDFVLFCFVIPLSPYSLTRVKVNKLALKLRVNSATSEANRKWLLDCFPLIRFAHHSTHCLFYGCMDKIIMIIFVKNRIRQYQTIFFCSDRIKICAHPKSWKPHQKQYYILRERVLSHLREPSSWMFFLAFMKCKTMVISGINSQNSCNSIKAMA